MKNALYDIAEIFRQAAEAVAAAEAFVITAGAGMGVDSGLPDFRGDKGFWNAYPLYARLGISFVEAANPDHFERDPAFGWGFYGHRTNLYRETVPHNGFSILKRWVKEKNAGHFVVTSNVDGQFQKAGFDEENMLEVHGSIHWLQCTTPCTLGIWPNSETIPVNFETMRARSIPRCIRCGRVSRPNILMFGDYSWVADRAHRQQRQFDQFLDELGDKKLVIIEMGAGTAIPTIRYTSENLGSRRKATVIRINPREAQIDDGQLSLPVGALEGLTVIDELQSKIRAITSSTANSGTR